MNELELIKELRRDEGEVLKAYKDTLGYWTIGIGHLIDPSRGADPAPFGVDLRKGLPITKGQSELLLLQDIKAKASELDKRLPWWRSLTDARQRALLNMAFNLGVNGLMGFKKTLAMISVGNYQGAADEMLRSTWAKQVKGRANRLAAMMVQG